MSVVETWLLPDGVADVLPEQAQVIEKLRRRLLDLLTSHGYELVYTPFIEYVESLSLHNSINSDLDLATFKLIDQLSGRLLGVRADMTPQVARIDAHVRPLEGIARYCYAATVLHTKPQGLSASRAPLQLGAELFGFEGLAADLEMVDLMLSVLKAAGFEQQLHLDLGHVDIFRNLSRIAGLTNSQEVTFTDLYQRKAIPELAEYVKQVNFGQDFYHLGRYSSDLSTLRQNLSPQVLADKRLQQALDALEQAQSHIKQYWPAINVGVDAAELRGYHYHTGLMFAVYTPNRAVPLAQGGRYDGIGIAFGRERPATGFSCDLYALAREQNYQASSVLIAPAGKDASLTAAIAQARQDGFVVIQMLDGQPSHERATHQLILDADQWQRIKL